MCKIILEQGHAEVVEGRGGAETPLPDLRGVRLPVEVEVSEKPEGGGGDLWTQESNSARRLKNT